MPTTRRRTHTGRGWGVRWSVRTRILAAILVVTAVGLTVAGFTAYLMQRERILIGIDEQLVHAVDSVRGITLGHETDESNAGEQSSTADLPPVAEFDGPEAALEAILARVLPERNESSLGIVNGSPRYVSAAATTFHLEDDPAFITRVISEVSDDTIRLGTYIGDLGKLRYVAVPIEVQGVDSRGIFVTAIDVEAELGEITTAFRTYTWVALATLAAVALVGWFVAGRLLKPVRTLRDTASRITASDLSERIPVTGNDDLSALTATVNGMLDRIEESVTSRRQLLDDVRHELKTPVTIVRGHLELLDINDPQDIDETRMLLIDELDRMTTLIDDIEHLADAEKLTVTLEPTDAGELLHQILLKCQALSSHNWVLSLGAKSTNDTVWVDSRRLTQAMLQLADNAVKYAADSPSIEIGYSAGPDESHFWVADEGPGIPPQFQERIFDRFGRVDSGRGIQGSGLGLAIVQAIASAHGGTVTLDSSPRGSRFTMIMPNQPAKEA